MRFSRSLLAGAALVGLAACTDAALVGPAASAGDARLDAAAASAPALVVTEVMADPRAVSDASGEWFEVHNPGAAPVDLDGWIFSSRNDVPHTIQGTLVVPAGGYVVLGNNADGATNGGVPVDYAYPSNVALANSSDWIALQDPDGAVVDNVTWTRSATSGASRALVDPVCDNGEVHGAAWRTSSAAWVGSAGDFGTPGASNGPPEACPVPPAPLPRGIIIHEVMANPAAVADDQGEWLELYNPGSQPVDLDGWRIVSRAGSTATEDDLVTGSLVVPAGGYLVLGLNADLATNGGVPVDHEVAGITLANSVDWVKLVDAAGATVDSVDWGTSAPSGSSRALIETYAATAADVGSAAWATSTARWAGSAGDRGSPGAANPAPPANSVIVAISDPARLPVGYTKPAFPTVRDQNGNVVSPLPALAWSSSDASVATVDARGYVTAAGEGEAFIRATLADGTSGAARITVIPASAPTSAVYLDHVAFGVPADGTPGDDVLLSKPQFVLSYSPVRGGPNWVSWNLNATHFGTADRCNCFTADASLPASVSPVVDTDYRGGGYDRGHMVQSLNRTTTEQENASTFLLTNILPQAGENNQGPWQRFENHLTDLARLENREVYVIAGGQYAPAPATVKGEGKVQIPDYTWKIAVVMPRGAGVDDARTTADLEVIAVRMPNLAEPGVPASALGIRDHDWQRYRTSVRSIEQATGYDFLAALPDSLEVLVETGTRAPVVVAGGPYSALVGEAIRFDGSASSDPDGDAISFRWSFGDGASASGASPSHTYASAGTFAVTLRVTDAHGAWGTAATTARVLSGAEAVAVLAARVDALAAAGTLSRGEANALSATLDAAARSLAAGNEDGARGQLGAFLNQVEALVRSRRLSAADGASLTELAERIRALLR